MKRRLDSVIETLSKPLNECEWKLFGWTEELRIKWLGIMQHVRADYCSEEWKFSVYYHSSFLRGLDSDGLLDGPLIHQILHATGKLELLK